MLEKATAIKGFEYSLLGRELKAQNDIAKDQYKFFKDQVNVIDNRKKIRVKKIRVIKLRVI